MKQLLFFLAFLCQLSISFAQCTLTEGTELLREFDYFTCPDGYNPPKGFEWMKPTRIYVQFGNEIIYNNDGTNGGYYSGKPQYYWNRVCRGENLLEVNDIFNNEEISSLGRGMMGYENEKERSSTLSGRNKDNKNLCLDCGLGYFALVTLVDDFAWHDKYNDFNPNQGFGFICGKSTPEEAFKVAWESARKALGKPAKSFSFRIGINTKVEKRKTHLSAYNIYTAVNMKTVPGWGSGDNWDYGPSELIELWGKTPKVGPIPDNGDELYKFIINNQYYTKYVDIEGITSEEFPVFTDKVGAGKQIGNAKKTEGNSTTNLQTNINLDLTPKEYSFGEIKYGVVVNYTFKLMNNIQKATAPGRVQLTVNGKNVEVAFHPFFVGEFLQRIQLTFDNGQTDELVIKGVVKK